MKPEVPLTSCHRQLANYTALTVLCNMKKKENVSLAIVWKR